MTEKTKSEIVKQAPSGESSSTERSGNHHKHDELELDQAPQRSRKRALSKREIMEEMSRARFPWEEDDF